MSKKYVLLSILIFGLLIPGFSVTQEKDDQKAISQSDLTYGVEVELVQIPVRVTNKDGEFVGGLKKEDFEAFEDGELQEIQYIDEIQGGTVTAEAPQAEEVNIPEAALAIPNSVFIIFDSANSGKLGLERHRTYLKGFVEKYRSAQTMFSLIEIKPSGDYEFIQSLTKNKQGILDGVDELVAGTTGFTERLNKTSQLSDTNQVEQCSAQRGESRDMCVENALRKIVRLANGFAVEDQVRSTNMIRSLKGLFNVINHVPGKKDVILISEGMDPTGGFYYNYGANVIQYFIERFGMRESNRLVLTEMRVEANRSMSKINEVAALTRSANAAGINVYWVDPEYGKTVGDISSELGTVSDFSQKLVAAPDIPTTMRGISEDTGGVALSSTNFNDFYRRIADNLSKYYLISYKPARALRDGKFHKSEIKAKNKDLKVYYPKDLKDHTLDERILNELAGAHDFPNLSDRFKVINEVQYFRKSDKKYQVTILTGIPYRELDPKIEQERVFDDVHYSYLIKDSKGKIVFDTHPILRIRSAEKELQTLRDENAVLEYRQTFVLDPGTYSVSVAAMSVAGWKSTSASDSIKLAGETDRCLSISPLLLSSIVEPSSQQSDAPILSDNGQMIYGKNAYSFPIVRFFPRKGQLSGFYQIYNAKPNGTSSTPSVFISFKLYRDKTVFVNQTPEHELKAYADPLQKLISSYFSVPYNNLLTGSYELELVARDANTGCNASSRIPFAVTSSSSQAQIQ
jgi:VWFA-related protein